MSDTPEEQFFLELGDIIRIIAPTNEDINEHVFYIDYIDKNQIDVVDDTSLVQHNLKLTEGQFNDKSIETIEILDRSEDKGYARQNNLVPGKSITLRFGGDVPTTINGTITDLEEDMIEIKTYPDEKIIYIDFAFHGIPKSLPLESIEDFIKPIDLPTDRKLEQKKQDDLSAIPEDDEIPELSMTMQDDEDQEDIEFDLVVPIANIRDRLKRIILDADDIQIGKSLGSITEEVPVEESSRRFGIETQANDLLDELLSTIPSSQRTSKTLNNIHLMIERFKQLRSQFSVISKEGEIMKSKIKGSDYKPLVEKLETFDKKLHWLLPIAKNRKKLYNIDDDEEKDDIIPVSLKMSQDAIEEYTDQFNQNRIPDGINKYKYLYRELNKLYTPFGNPTDPIDIITEQRVHDNFDMIIDNLGDFYSSVSIDGNAKESGNVDRKRFLMTRYNTGLTELEVDKMTKTTGYNPKRIPLTQNDKVAISGIMTLEEPALLYSHINLPNSSILLKSHLSLVTFNYWSILKKNREIVNIDVELDNDIQQQESGFLNNINAFMFKEKVKFADRKEDSFKMFLDKVIPRTRQLFALIKKYINHSTSYLKIIEYLEPFLVYPDDITFKQYETILEFLGQQIANFKKNIVKNEIDYNTFISNKFPTNKINNLKNILDIKSVAIHTSDINITEAINEYNMGDFTTSEAVRDMMLLDSGRLYYSIICDTDMDLYQPIDIDELIKEEMTKTPEEKTTDPSCPQFTMAKKYIDIDELREDDGNDIYFDKKYDPTRYDVLEEFKTEQEMQAPNDFKIFLINHLIHNVGMSTNDAQIEASSLIEGKRRVQPKEYAYLLDDYYQPVYYYRDDNNTWIKNEELSGKKLNEIMFCNLKDSCISIKKKCGPIEINKKQIQKNLYKDILSHFDKQFHISIDKLKKSIKASLEYNYLNARRLKYLKNILKKKNQTQRENLAKTLEERDILISPHEELRNKILSQQDFIKKQKDVIAFCNKYTRTYVENNPTENEFWFYCIDTSIPLIPSFYKRLADAFYIGQYEAILDKVKNERGKLSDDGDKIVDRFSGFTISKIDYDESEGYNEQGFKIVSKAIIEENIEQVIANLDFTIQDTSKSKNYIMIQNVISTMDKNLGISVNSELEFIHNLVNTILSKILPSQKIYEKALLAKKSKKKPPSYEQAYNNALMMSTLSAYLIVIQTMMPSIITKTTFPTCNRSFNGYPLDGDGDTSALQYISCAAINIARGSDSRPWTSLPRVRKKIGITETINKYISKLKIFIDSKFLTNEDVKKKISDKLHYLKHYVENETIPEEFDVKNWATFLPPLRPVRISRINNISPSFNTDLNRMLSTGDPYQFSKLSELNSKIFYFSLHIQELIQRVVNKKKIQLFSLTNEPFIENSCCNDGSKHTLQYFINIEPNITKFNANVEAQSKLLERAMHLIKSPFIFNAQDTRLVFPPVSKNFSEETIYKTFIKFCKFNSGITLPDELVSICGPNMSEFTHLNTLSEKIKIMKHEGKNFSTASFYHLLNVINSENIVDVNFTPIIITGRLQIEQLLTNNIIQQNIETTPLKKIIDILKNLFDSYETTRERNDEGIRLATAYLDEQLDILMNYNIKPFLSKYGVGEEFTTFITNIEKFKSRGDNIYISREDETEFAGAEFLKNIINDILKIYPSIIINNVDYKDITIPKHWKLAPSHKTDVLDAIKDEFSPLQEFYHDKSIISLLKIVLTKSQDLLDIMYSTPFYANIKESPGGERYNTLLNGKLLEKFMKFYFLYAINIYIDIVNKDETDLQAEISSSSNSLNDDVVESMMSGRNIEIKERLSQLLIAYLKLLMSNKSILNFSDIEVKEAVIKAAEREKSKIVENLGKLSQEELQVEDILKNQKLGKWSVGLTKAIYEYDQGQYEKERLEFQQDATMVMRLNNIPIDDQTTALLDMLQEGAQNNRRVNESNAIMQQMGNDDDFGDYDGDESY